MTACQSHGKLRFLTCHLLNPAAQFLATDTAQHCRRRLSRTNLERYIMQRHLSQNARRALEKNH